MATVASSAPENYNSHNPLVTGSIDSVGFSSRNLHSSYCLVPVRQENKSRQVIKAPFAVFGCLYWFRYWCDYITDEIVESDWRGSVSVCFLLLIAYVTLFQLWCAEAQEQYSHLQAAHLIFSLICISPLHQPAMQRCRLDVSALVLLWFR